MRVRTLFIGGGVAAILVGLLAIATIWRVMQDETRAAEQQLIAQQISRHVAGLVGVTYMFQRERDELSIAEWKSWHGGIVRDLEKAGGDKTKSDLALLRDSVDRLPVLFDRALETAAVPATDFEKRRRDQAFDLLLGDTQAMADAAFRWSRDAAEEQSRAADLHAKVTTGAIGALILLMLGLAALAARRVLKPLATLTTATEALERGEQVPLFESTSKDELGLLKRRFDAMTLALRRRTEELQDAERRTRAITDSIPVLVTEFDSDSRIVFANATVSKVYGLPLEGVIGKTVSEIRGEDGAEQVRPHIEAVLNGDSVEFDSTQRFASTIRHFHQLYVPRRDVQGNVVGFYSVSVDITERKSSEHALQISEQRLASILLQSPDAFVCTDAQGRITDWNPAAEATFGWTREEVTGRRLSDVLIPEEHRAAHDAGMAAFVKTGEGRIIGKRLELPALHRDGTVVPTELSIGALSSGDGHAAFAFIRDIRERLAAQEELRQSQSRLQQVLGTIPALVGYFDRDVRCRYANALARGLQRLAPGEEIGLHLREAIGPDNYALHEPYLPQVLAGQRAHFEGCVKQNGRDVHFQVHLVPEKDAAGEVSGFYVMTFDVTALKQAQLEQERARRQLRAITDNLPVMISYIDAAHRLQFLNRTFENWTGVAVSDALGKPMRDVIGDHLYQQRRIPLEQALQGQRVEFEVVSQALGVERVLQTVYIPDCPTADSTVGVYTLTSDVTALRQAERRMAELALTDTLTGLANRRSFEQNLPLVLARAARNRTGTGLMFLDVDHFKRVNDTYGHAAGDAVLVAFSQRLAGSVRSTDFVARLAGDEFVVVLEGMKSADECDIIALKVNAAARGAIPYESEQLQVTTSIGLAYVGAGVRCAPDELLRYADEALYRTKERGRDGFTTVEAGSSAPQFTTSSFGDLV